VDVTATLDTPHAPDALFRVVEDLTTYPRWLDIVPRVVPDDGEAGPAWKIDLRGRLGPFARSKRLRMVRTEHVEPQKVVFERRELDGRNHSPWVLTAEVQGAGSGSRLVMHLHYGGGLFGPVLERLLGDEIERSKPKLLALLDAS
jgi:hypothetical protein